MFIGFFNIILSPFDVGLPCAGRRCWAAAAASCGKLAITSDPFAGATLQQCVWRSVAGTPAMWLCADDSQVESYLEAMNEVRDRIPPHPRQKRYRPEDVIGASYAGRLHFHRLNAAKIRNERPE